MSGRWSSKSQQGKTDGFFIGHSYIDNKRIQDVVKNENLSSKRKEEWVDNWQFVCTIKISYCDKGLLASVVGVNRLGTIAQGDNRAGLKLRRFSHNCADCVHKGELTVIPVSSWLCIKVWQFITIFQLKMPRYFFLYRMEQKINYSSSDFGMSMTNL